MNYNGRRGKCVHPIHFSLSPIGSLPSPDVTLSPTSSASTGSYISNWFLARGLFIALMVEAASTCETSVNFYQTTRRHNPETLIFILAAVRTPNPTGLKIANGTRITAHPKNNQTSCDPTKAELHDINEHCILIFSVPLWWLFTSRDDPLTLPCHQSMWQFTYLLTHLHSLDLTTTFCISHVSDVQITCSHLKNLQRTTLRPRYA
jgi:hypothetical protein